MNVKVFAISAWFLFTAGLSVLRSADAASSLNCKDATEIINHYVELDNKGETTHPSSRLVGDLIDFENGDLPAWDTLYVIKSAKVSGCTIRSGRAIVLVTRIELGAVSSGGDRGEYPVFEIYNPVRKKTVKMELHQKEGEWKINYRTATPPHELTENVVKDLESSLDMKKRSVDAEAKTRDTIQKLKAIQ